MYNVSQAYITAIRRPAIRTRLSGTVAGVPFDESNVVRDSFTITNQTSGSDGVQIGTVYTAELEIILTGVTFPRYSLKGAEITADFYLLTAPDTYESVPLGVYYISECEYTPQGVKIKAYDAVSKLEKRVTTQTAVGSAYSLARLACNACGLILANTGAEFMDFANGTVSLQPYTEGSDISTWRDWLAWLAQAVGCYVTATRSGDIQFRPYGTTVVDTIDTAHRFIDVRFSDFVTRYTGLSVVNMGDQKTSYYKVEPDDALVYNLGSNPFLQYGTDSGKAVIRTAVLNALQAVQYVPFTATTVCNPAYDLGDVLSFPGGLGDASKLFCVTKFEWKYGAYMKLQGVGANPVLQSANSKTEKNLSGLAQQSADAASLGYYTYVNAEDVTIADGDTAEIFSIDYVTRSETQVVFHAELNGTVYPTATDGTVVGTVQYWLDDEPVAYRPKFSEPAGYHLEHLLFAWQASENDAGNFRAQLTAEGGSITFPAGSIRAVMFGQGFAGEGGDKSLIFTDAVPALTFAFYGGFTDAVEIELIEEE